MLTSSGDWTSCIECNFFEDCAEKEARDGCYHGCSDCTLQSGSSNSVYPLDELLEEAQDRIEERRAIYGSEIL